VHAPPPDDQRTGLSGADIATAGVGAVRWTGAGQVVGQLAALAAAPLLARLISPAEFGVVAAILVVLGVSGALAQQGITAALVQRPSVRKEHWEAGAALALGAGLMLGAAVLVAAPLVAAPLAGDRVAQLLQLGALSFPLAALGATARASLERGLRFAPLAGAGIASSLVGSLGAVGLALAGLDAHALVGGALAATGAGSVWVLAVARPPGPRWRPRAMREIAAFGLPTSLGNAASIVSQNVDYAVLATRTDPATLGHYWRGYQLGVGAHGRLSGVLLDVGLPLYARTGDPAERLALRGAITRLQTLLLFPLLGLLILLAPVLVPAVLGSAWEPAVVPTQILAVAGMASVVQTGIGPLLVALGRPGAVLRWNVGNIALLGLVAWWAAPLGLVGLCLAVLGFRLARFATAVHVLFGRIAGIPARRILSDCAPALAGVLALLAAGATAQQAAGAAGAPDWAGGVAAALAGSAVYAAVVRLGFPAAWAELIAVLRRVLSKPRLRTRLPRHAAVRRA
jgi:O-antigen/teichoic acid export membrane protein